MPYPSKDAIRVARYIACRHPAFMSRALCWVAVHAYSGHVTHVDPGYWPGIDKIYAQYKEYVDAHPSRETR